MPRKSPSWPRPSASRVTPSRAAEPRSTACRGGSDLMTVRRRSLTVGADPQLNVNYSQAWDTGVAVGVRRRARVALRRDVS